MLFALLVLNVLEEGEDAGGVLREFLLGTEEREAFPGVIFPVYLFLSGFGGEEGSGL